MEESMEIHRHKETEEWTKRRHCLKEPSAAHPKPTPNCVRLPGWDAVARETVSLGNPPQPRRLLISLSVCCPLVPLLLPRPESRPLQPARTRKCA